MQTPALVEIAKSAPPAGAVVAYVAAVPLATWVQIATLIWTIFLIIEKLPVIVDRIRSFHKWLKE
jgi:hypothetical protein